MWILVALFMYLWLRGPPKVDKQPEIAELTELLDNLNARLKLQSAQLAELERSYKTAFNEKRKMHLLNKMLSTEAAILRLTKQSNKTSAKIWKLDD